MIYQGKEVEILSKQTIFGKTIAEVDYWPMAKSSPFRFSI